MITNNNGFVSPNAESFVISDYLDLLTKVKGIRKYICPVCGGNDLSINKDGKRYTCYSSHCDTKEIAYKLREANGEFNKKSDLQKDLLQVSKSIKAFNSGTLNNDENEDSSITIGAGQTEIILKNNQVLSFVQNITKGIDLKYNLRSKEIEWNGKALDLDLFRMQVQENNNIFINSREILIEAMFYQSKKNEYDPVKLFLEKCYRDYDPEVDENFKIEEVCQVLFGVNDPLYCEYLYRWLIGLVARVWEPGCKFDEAFVLQGEPDCYKSSFFKTLAGEIGGQGYFTDSMESTDNSGLLILAKNWVLEWAEIDKMTAKTYHGTVKAFLSRSEDMYRVPYGRDAQRYPRRSVIVGTCNRETFLTDPTGNRRFWIIPLACGHVIPLDYVQAVREKLLGWAVWKYLDGEKWQLPDQYKELQKAENKRWEHDDSWMQALSNFLDQETDVSTLECLKKLENGGFTVNYSRNDEMRMGDILKKVGFSRKQVRRGDKREYRYLKD